MRFGITIPITGVDGDVRQAVDYACLAEKAGWDGVFIEDYIVHYHSARSPVFDPWIVMARSEERRVGKECRL